MRSSLPGNVPGFRGPAGAPGGPTCLVRVAFVRVALARAAFVRAAVARAVALLGAALVVALALAATVVPVLACAAPATAQTASVQTVGFPSVEGRPVAQAQQGGGFLSQETAASILLRDVRRIYSAPPDVDPGKVWLLGAATCAVLLVDQDLYDQVTADPRNPEMERLGGALTDLGTGLAALGICGLVALDDAKAGYLAANAVIYSGIGCTALKVLLGRARPQMGDGPYAFTGPCIREGYNSMPSGHSATAFALATVLARQYPKYRALFYTGAALVALSRVYERAHWPSDTLVGAAIGVWSANHVIGESRLFEVRW